MKAKAYEEILLLPLNSILLIFVYVPSHLLKTEVFGPIIEIIGLCLSVLYVPYPTICGDELPPYKIVKPFIHDNLSYKLKDAPI